MLKEVLIILAVLLYWKFIHYKYHQSKYGGFIALIPTTIAIIVGLYSYFFEKNILLFHFFVIYSIVAVYYLIGVIFISIASKKHGLSNKIDVIAEWTVRVFGKTFYAFALIVSLFLLFFSVVGTYRILGFEHIYLWAMIILAWSRSGIKLFRNYVIK